MAEGTNEFEHRTSNVQLRTSNQREKGASFCRFLSHSFVFRLFLRLDSHRDCGTLPHDGTNQTAQTDNVMNGSTDSPTLAAPFPVNLELAVGLTRSELEQHLRLMAALKMFELGKISSGKAAQLAGMCRVDFFETCGRYRVSLFNYPPEEIEEELRRELQTLNDQEATTT
jgi:predicted HTH domain antitoxin